ncbi:RNA polymerase sigma factor, sigma-70 family [Klenkia terrae]|nr:RNA polymerase sigma factor, sigma-70 family [Klenkia terrae]
MMHPMTAPRAVRPPAGDDVWDRAAELFTAWYDGRPTAMDELVRTLTPVLWQVARGCRLPAEDAADVVQHAWLALVGHAGSIQDPRSVGAWLVTTVRRESIRRTAAGGRTVGAEDAVLDRWADPAPPAEDVALAGVETRRLWQAVRTLSARCQELLRVVAFDRRPDYALLSARLGMPVGSIGPTRGRCLAKLRTALGEVPA